MTWDRRAAWDLLEAIAPKLIRRLRMTQPGDTAWEQYTMQTEIDGKVYDSTVRVEMKSKRDGKSKDEAPAPRKRQEVK